MVAPPLVNPNLKSAFSAMQTNLIQDDKAGESSFDSWSVALRTLFPTTFIHEFSEAQIEYWDWVWSIEKGVRPRPYTYILPRGGGKTTSCEVTGILLGAENKIKYCWYIQETQTQADKRIANIAEKLESVFVSNYYPSMSERWVGKFGNEGGWRRSFVRTASNIVFEAIGLDKAARSSKVGDVRPDLIIIDDVDSKYDTEAAVKKKLGLLTHTLLPAADSNAVIIFSQNLVHYNSIASKLADQDNTEFLQDRIISGPYPALYDFHHVKEYDPILDREVDKITNGEPLWQGQGIEECQNYINTYGLTSFNTECQHEVETGLGSIWADMIFQRCTYEDVPDILVGCVWCDPAVTNTKISDCYAIQADGLGADNKIYRLMSSEEKSTPLVTLEKAILWCVELGFDFVGVETDQGGDTWEVVYNTAWKGLIANRNYPHIGDTTKKPKFREAKAGAGFGSKAHRNSLMYSDYELGKVIHVIGHHEILEGSLHRFLVAKPFDLADAAFWGWDFLSNRRWAAGVGRARSSG
jgi:hypothetical protein